MLLELGGVPRPFSRSRLLTMAVAGCTLALGVPVGVAQAASGVCTTSAGVTSCTFTLTGGVQMWEVPAGVTSATFEVFGAQGGTGALAGGTRGLGGLGAQVSATLPVSAGQQFQVMVGGAGTVTAGGFNGGGAGGTSASATAIGGGGGGASDVRTGGCAAGGTCGLTDRIIVAGGGGGGASVGGDGGAAGAAGADGSASPTGGTPGGGGTMTVGGAGGASANGGSTPGGAGALGAGGSGGFANCGCGGAGGGGGGLYGGGGGGYQGGGGGGSSTGPTGSTVTGGVNSGDGRIVVSFAAPDATPPVITPTVTGAVGSNGWYTSDVSLTWTVTDEGSTVSNTSGCGPATITTDTAGVTFTCEAASAGGTAQQAVTIRRDATAPIVTTGTPDRAPNAAGWYSAPVTVAFTGQDATSGIAGCTAPTYDGPDSATASVPGTCTDNAGNTSGAQRYPFKYDATKPMLTPTVSPDPVTQGQTATASAGASDALSGVASSSCDSVDTGSVGSASVQCSATDNAGNVATGSASYTVACVPQPPPPGADPGTYPDGCGGTVQVDDSTAPTVALTTPAFPNAAGWFNAPVSFTANATDNPSSPDDFSVVTGIDCSGATLGGVTGIGTKNASRMLTVTAQGTSAVTCTATDSFGNASSPVTTTVKLDSIAPVLAPALSPSTLTAGVPATLAPNASDGGSGVAATACSVVDTSSAGTRTGTCTATDMAGNTSSATITYTVSAAAVPPAPVTTTVTTRAFFALWSTKLSEAQKAALREQVAAIPAGATITARATGVVRAAGATKADRRRALKRANAVRAYLATLGIRDAAVSNKGRTTSTSAKARRVNLTITWTIERSDRTGSIELPAVKSSWASVDAATP